MPPARIEGLAGAAAVIVLTLFINLLALVPPLAILLLFDGAKIAASERNVAVLVLAVAVALGLEILLTAARNALIAWREARKEHSVGQHLFARVLDAQPSTRGNSDPGSDADRFAAIERVREFRVERVGALLLDLPFTFLFLTAIFLIGGWIVAVPAVILGCVTALLLTRSRAVATAAREAGAIRGRQVNFALETLARIASIKSAALEAPMMRRFERLVASGARMDEQIARGALVDQVAPTMIVSVAVVGVLALAIPALMASSLGIGEVLACVLLAVRATSPARRVLAAFPGWHDYRLDEEQIGAALCRPLFRAEGLAELPRLQGAIKLEDVTIRTDDDEAPLLDSVSMQIPAGATIGVTGAAGSGKTTLLMLIAGQRRPDAGRILLDGRFDPLAHTEDSTLRQLACVPDHAPLYAGTLLDNITMFAGPIAGAASGASVRSRERAHDLAERLGLMPLAARLPLGFNTRIGPGSTVVLPPGTAQRIALARAFFAAPRILLLDLANSALDPTGDALFQRLLEEERGTCTMLIVSQRPSLLRLTDRVYNLSDGLLRSPSPSRQMSMVRQRMSA
jgi:ATP-binding cassette, subfamily C, bacterial LapB